MGWIGWIGLRRLRESWGWIGPRGVCGWGLWVGEVGLRRLCGLWERGGCVRWIGRVGRRLPCGLRGRSCRVRGIGRVGGVGWELLGHAGLIPGVAGDPRGLLPVRSPLASDLVRIPAQPIDRQHPDELPRRLPSRQGRAAGRGGQRRLRGRRTEAGGHVREGRVARLFLQSPQTVCKQRDRAGLRMRSDRLAPSPRSGSLVLRCGRLGHVTSALVDPCTSRSDDIIKNIPRVRSIAERWDPSQAVTPLVYRS